MAAENKKPTIVMLLGGMPNPRLYKRIDLLKQMSDLHLICWDRGARTLDLPVERGYAVHIIKQNAESDPVKRLLPYMRFYKGAMTILKELCPSVIYLQGLDMLMIARAYKTRHKAAHIIYEVADIHRLIADKQKSLPRKLAHHAAVWTDRSCCKDIALLVVTSEKYYDTYFSSFVPQDRMLYIPNIPDLSIFETYQKKEPSTPLTIGFIGAIRYKQQMHHLMSAAQACGMKVMIAGFEKGSDEIERSCKAYPQGEWFGRFDFAKHAAELYGKCDLIYCVYDADMENVRIALPNKLYESVYCQTPLIVAKNTYLSELVEEWGVGVAVNHKDVKELTEVFDRLQNCPEYYNSLVQNCRNRKHDFDLSMYNQMLKERIKPLI